MKTPSKKHLTSFVILTLFISGVLLFGEDRYNNNDDDIIIPTEFIFQGQKIALAWTDDNTGEDLIIQSDRKEYSGFNEVDVYFSITNTNKEDQEMDVVVWVKDEKVEVKEILKIDGDNNFQFPISPPEADQPWAGNQFPNRKDVNGFTAGYAVNNQIKTGETNFYRAKIKYPPMSEGEFFIEVFGFSDVSHSVLRRLDGGLREGEFVETDKPLSRQSGKRNDKLAYGHLDPWYSSSWSYHRQITIDHSEIADVADPSATYAGFPVYVHATGLSNIKADGADIRFTDSAGTELPREIEKYASGTLDAWVKFTLTKDSSDSSDDVIYMYYGNDSAVEPAPDSAYGRENVWDDNFVMVQHLQEDPGPGGAGDIVDSTQYDNDGTAEASMETEDQVAGQIDGSLDFDRTSNYVQVSRNSSIEPVNNMTISAWIKFQSDSVAAYQQLIAKDKNVWSDPYYSYNLRWSGNLDQFEFSINTDGTGHGVQANTGYSSGWRHLVALRNGTVLQLYLDGTQIGADGSCGSGAITYYAADLFLGYDSNYATGRYDGILDEVRISNTARSAGWIETEYNNQNDLANFITIGAEKMEMSNLIITTSAKILARGTESTAFIVQVQDINGNAVNVGSDTIVNLSSDSSGVYHFAATPGGAEVSFVTIMSGSNSINFYYTDNKAGVPNITVSATDFAFDTQQQTVKGDWYNIEYRYRRQIILEADQIAITTSAFPILVIATLADLKTTTNGGNVENDSGYDIIFVNVSGTTLLNFEQEKYVSSTGEIVYWVNTDISSTMDKVIYMYYGNASATNLSNAEGVWDDNFVMVQHLQETPDNSADQIEDSTSNNNDGQTVTMASDDQVAGQIDGSFDFDGDSDYVDAGNTTSLDITNAITISAWVKPNSFPAFSTIVGKFSNTTYEGWHIASDDNTANYRFWIKINGTNKVLHCPQVSAPVGFQYYLVGVYNGSNVIFYLNGAEKDNQVASGDITTNNDKLVIGRLYDDVNNYYFNGLIDEVRISNIARTAGWIETEYNNQSDAESFMTIGAEENLKLDITTVAKVILTGIESTAFTVQAQDSDGIAVNVGNDVTVNLSSDSSGTYHFAATPGGAEVSSVTISSGTDSVDFYYTDNEAGSPTIVVSATNFVSDDQQQTVVKIITQLNSPYTNNNDWYNANWKYKRAITLEADHIETTESEFPVLVSTTLADLKSYAYDGHVGNDNGYDIIFVDDDNSTLLNFEQEKYVPSTGEIVYWVNTDISSTTDKVIYMYYGNVSATDISNAEGIWDSNYKGVWHMNQDPSIASTIDSTINSNDGTSGGSMTSSDLINAQIGQGIDFDGADDLINCGKNSSLNNMGPLTWEAWIYPRSRGEGNNDAPAGRIIDKLKRFFMEDINGGSRHIGLTTVVSPLTYRLSSNYINYNSQWHHIVVTWTGASSCWSINFYIDGVLRNNGASGSGSSEDDSAYDLIIGNLIDGTRTFDGLIDEVRVSNIVRTVGWIETEYNNQSGAVAFLDIGVEEGLNRTAIVNAPITNYLTDGLVGHWTFNGQNMDWGSSTAEALDMSGQGNHGDVIGATAVIGKVGQGLEFDGTDDYVEKSSPNGTWELNDFTVSAFIKTTVGDDYHTIFSVDRPSFCLRYGKLKIYHDASNQPIGSGTVNDGNIHHVAFSRTGTNVTFYIDGNFDASGTYSLSWNTPTVLRIGRNVDWAEPFIGIIDEVRVYNRALSEDEIGQLYRIGARKMGL